MSEETMSDEISRIAGDIARKKVNIADFPCHAGYHGPSFGGDRYNSCIEKTTQKEIDRMKNMSPEDIFARYERIMR